MQLSAGVFLRGSGGGDGVQLLHPAAAALVLLQGEILPLGLHFFVFLQHGAGFGVADAHFAAALHDLAQNDGVEPLPLQVGAHGDEQQVNGVVLAEGVEHMGPARGEQAAAALFQGFGDAGGADTEGHQLVFLVQHEARPDWG